MRTKPTIRTETVELESLKPADYNPREMPQHEMEALKTSMARWGLVEPIVVNKDNTIVGGHQRWFAAKELGWKKVEIKRVFLKEDEARLLNIALNRIHGRWDEDKLTEVLEGLQAAGADLELTGMTERELDYLLDDLAKGSELLDELAGGSAGRLQQRFGAPPFTVLDARQGYWRDRRERWLALGIASHEGRAENLLHMSETVLEGGKGPREFSDPYQGGDAWAGRGTSVFDPVLTELVLKWFCPPGGIVHDPFAGGSVRGVVSALLGYRYWGWDIRPEQVEANRAQWQAIVKAGPRVVRSGPELPDRLEETPIQQVPGKKLWLKRDDLFSVAGVEGGKVRTCWFLAQGAKGLVTAGSRSSPQVNIVAHIAQRLGLPCRAHVPSGELGPELLAAQDAGAEIIQHAPGYNTVIVARAREDAKARGWTEIPFGMEHLAAVSQTASQVPGKLPKGVKRIVVPVGSGMSLAGVLAGLKLRKLKVPVLGVQVGADPTKRLDRFAEGWRDMVELVRSKQKYEEAVEGRLGEIELDPIYEAKCLPFLKAGDLLWIVGRRQTGREEQASSLGSADWKLGDAALLPLEGQKADLLFSCPPYWNLERYSELAGDISNAKTYRQFLGHYEVIMGRWAARLKDGAFACFVVANFRGEDGELHDLVGDTVRIFQEHGLAFYNDAVLVQPIGSLALRVQRFFLASRKLGKTHQNVLVFFKGKPEEAPALPRDLVSFPELKDEEE